MARRAEFGRKRQNTSQNPRKERISVCVTGCSTFAIASVVCFASSTRCRDFGLSNELSFGWTVRKFRNLTVRYRIGNLTVKLARWLWIGFAQSPFIVFCLRHWAFCLGRFNACQPFVLMTTWNKRAGVSLVTLRIPVTRLLGCFTNNSKDMSLSSGIASSFTS